MIFFCSEKQNMRSFYKFEIFFETNIEVLSNATEIYNISFNKKKLRTYRYYLIASF